MQNSTLIALGVAGLGIMAAGGIVLVLVVRAQAIEPHGTLESPDATDTESLIKQAEETTKALQAFVDERSAQTKRMNSATFRASRMEIFDDNCVGAGLPKLAYKIVGSTFADNALAADAYDCKKRWENLEQSDLFCCPNHVKATFRTSAEIVSPDAAGH